MSEVSETDFLRQALAVSNLKLEATDELLTFCFSILTDDQLKSVEQKISQMKERGPKKYEPSRDN